MIHKSSLILFTGLLFVAYQIGNPILIKLIWVLFGIIFLFSKISHYIDHLLKKPLFAISSSINFIVLTIFYFLIFSPYALVFRVVSGMKKIVKADCTNFKYRNHEYHKNDLIRTF
jgi:hypothetical protein